MTPHRRRPDAEKSNRSTLTECTARVVTDRLDIKASTCVLLPHSRLAALALSDVHQGVGETIVQWNHAEIFLKMSVL
jgi:hypothetical protein